MERSRMKTSTVTISTVKAACRILLMRKPIKTFPPNGPVVPVSPQLPSPRDGKRRPGVPSWPLALDEVPVLRVDVERRGLRDDSAQVVGDLGELVDPVRLPDDRDLLRQVVLPVVQR